MIMIRTTLFASARLVLLAALFHAISLGLPTGPIPGVAGAPGENNCTLCHAGSEVNSGGGSLSIEMVGASQYVPGQQYRIRVSLSDPSAQRWGFQLTARQTAATGTTAGALASDTSPQLMVQNTSNLQYINHTINATFQGQSGSASWEFFWTAPPANVGTVTFYAAGNAANNNGNNGGDHIYTTTFTIAPQDSGGPTMSYAIPQFVYGDDGAGAVWHTALYLTNTTGQAQTASIRFRDDSGNDLDVPGYGTSPTVNLPANGTAVIDPPTTAAIKQGWAIINAPEGVVGYAVFRFAYTGRQTQEAVVLFSDDTRPAYNLTFDDQGRTTSFAIVNTGDTAVNVQVTCRDTGGTQLGAAQITVAAREKVVVNNWSQVPGLAPAIGNRGSAEFRVGSGKMAVLGLRFANEAFTSVPVQARQ